jgi:uncharacterized repeat protein (TIGR01451 family)
MKHVPTRCRARVFLLAAVAFSLHANAQIPTHYDVIDVGTLGGSMSYGLGLNNRGEVVGNSWTTSNRAIHAFVYRQGSIITVGPTSLAAVPSSFCNGINSSGLMAGVFTKVQIGPMRPDLSPDTAIPTTTNDTKYYAFLSSGSTLTDLKTLGGRSAYGQAINDSKQVAGYSDVTGNTAQHAALFVDGSNPQDMQTLGGTNSFAYSINKFGKAAGFSDITGDTAQHAAAFSIGNAPKDLGTLGGDRSYSYAINDLGQAAGYSYLTDNITSRAFVYDENSNLKLTDLRAIGGSFSDARGINNSVQVVGTSATATGGVIHVFLYSGGKIADVNNRVVPSPSYFTLTDAKGVNDGGQITGTGVHNGLTRAYLATPFYRQIDAPITADVPTTFGYVKPSTQLRSSTKDFGCALTSAANMARSLVALKAKLLPIRVITPARLDDYLTTSGDGYTHDAGPPENYNNLDWDQGLRHALASIADIKLVGTPTVGAADLGTAFQNHIYGNQERVILQFLHTRTNQTTHEVASGSHFVWVIGKEGNDWKAADPGWNSAYDVNDQPHPEFLSSLQAHLDGFYTHNSKGEIISHQFVPSTRSTLLIFRNTTYSATSAQVTGSKMPVRPFQTSTATASNLAALSINIVGPADFVLTDPVGHRLGHDQLSNVDYSEIVDGSYFKDSPILSPDGDSPNDFEGSSQITRISVPSPIDGTYTLQSTGTAPGTLKTTFYVVGPGGSANKTSQSIPTDAGQSSTQQIPYSTTSNAADLSIEQMTSPGAPQVGGSLTYTLTVTNDGPSSATALQFADLLPDNVNFVSATADGGTWTQSANVISCQLPSLAAGASTTITIVTTPQTSGTVTNTASVTAFEADLDLTDNSAQAQISVGITFAAWRNLKFTAQELANPSVSGANADPDNDGVPNLMEYASNLDPKVADTSNNPVLTTVTVGPDRYAAISYRSVLAATDLVYSPQVSADLFTWSAAYPQAVSQVNNPDSSQTTIVRDTVPIPQPGKRFMRLRVTQQ